MIAGPELHQARVDAERQAAEVSQAVLHELQRAVNDLLERQDVILASYDRRVAALTNRVLELEDRLPARVASGRIADANELLADHEPVDGVNGNR